MKLKRPAEPANGKLENFDNRGIARLEAHFEYGKRHGQLIIRYENGQTMAEGYWVNGVSHGPWRLLFENGQTKGEGEFYCGQRIGRWREWDIHGNLIRDEYFGDRPLTGNN